MKLANFKDRSKYGTLIYRYETATEALNEVNKILVNKAGLHLSNGGVTPQGKTPLYSLFINTYKDGSGGSIELTGLMLHLKLYEFLKVELEKVIADIEKEIADL